MTQTRAPLTHLFDADLQYDDAVQPHAQLQDAGELVGSVGDCDARSTARQAL